MEQFIQEHADLVVYLVMGLLGVVSGLAKREFLAIQRHQDRQDERLDTMSEDLKRIERENADSVRDREGLHVEISAIGRNLEKQLDNLAKTNTDAHNVIIQMIKRNGGSR